MKVTVVVAAMLAVGCTSAELHVERDSDGNLVRCDMEYTGMGRTISDLDAQVCGSGVSAAHSSVDPELKNAIPLYLVPQLVAPGVVP